MTFTPRADGSYDVRATDATGRHAAGRVHGAAERRGARADGAAAGRRTARRGGPLPSAGATRDVGGERAAADHRRRAPRRLAGRGVAERRRRDGVPGRAGRAPRPTGTAPRMTLSLAAAPRCSACRGSSSTARPRFLASQRRTPIVRLLETGTLAPPPVIERRGPDPRRRRQPARPRAARRRRRARAHRAGARHRRRGRAGATRLARAGVAGRPASGASATATTTSSTTSGTATSRPTATACIYLEDPDDGNAVEVDETLFANLLSDQNALRLVVLNSCEGARTTLTDPYAGVATTLVQLGVPAVVAMQFEISDRAGDPVRRGAVHEPDRPAGPDRCGGRRGPQGDLQRGRQGRVGDAGAVPARPGRRAVPLRSRRPCRRSTEQATASRRPATASTAVPLVAATAGDGRRRGRRRPR